MKKIGEQGQMNLIHLDSRLFFQLAKFQSWLGIFRCQMKAFGALRLLCSENVLIIAVFVRECNYIWHGDIPKCVH